MNKLIIFLAIVVVFSCKNKSSINKNTDSNKIENKQHQIKNEYNGVYHLQGKNDCKLVISLKDSIYNFETFKRSHTSKIELSKENEELYIKLLGLFGDDPKEVIQVKYEDNKLIIQNYGNNMNPFTRLSECGSKYLILVKN